MSQKAHWIFLSQYQHSIPNCKVLRQKTCAVFIDSQVAILTLPFFFRKILFHLTSPTLPLFKCFLLLTSCYPNPSPNPTLFLRKILFHLTTLLNVSFDSQVAILTLPLNLPFFFGKFLFHLTNLTLPLFKCFFWLTSSNPNPPLTLPFNFGRILFHLTTLTLPRFKCFFWLKTWHFFRCDFGSL